MATKIANLKSSREDIIRQKWSDFSFAQFTVTTITNAPQQSNCFDCGVFVINWLEGRQRQYLNDSKVFIFIKLYFKSYIYLYLTCPHNKANDIYFKLFQFQSQNEWARIAVNIVTSDINKLKFTLTDAALEHKLRFGKTSGC